MTSRVLLSTFLLSLVSLPLQAQEGRVTPYGDYCAECAAYGVCKEVLPQEQAVRAMDKYYRDRGYRVGEVQHRGRFIEAVIYKDERVVDRVIFDRKNGRMRSIY